jgi:hypothetical protein
MIELSPAGIATIPGNVDKVEQLAKTFVGLTVMGVGAYLAYTGDSTWSAPSGEKDKQLFYASGKRPYSFKVGNQWVSFQRIGPLALPLMLPAAYKYYFEQARSADKDNIATKWTKVLLAGGQYFAAQTYVQSIGNIVDISRGDLYAVNRLASNVPSQFIPLISLQSWVTRIIDPVFRKPAKDFSFEGVIENLMTRIPGLSRGISPYTDMRGKPSIRHYPLFNAFSPFYVSPSLSVGKNRIRLDAISKRRGDLLKKRNRMIQMRRRNAAVNN